MGGMYSGSQANSFTQGCRMRAALIWAVGGSNYFSFRAIMEIEHLTHSTVQVLKMVIPEYKIYL